MMRKIAKGLGLVVMALTTVFFWLASWGMVMGDKYPIRFNTCDKGSGVRMAFARTFSWTTFAHASGSEMIYVETRGIAVPGFIIARVRTPYCTDASVEEVADYLRNYKLGLVRRRPEHAAALSALREGYERAEEERRARGGHVLDDDLPEDTTTIPQEEVPDEGNDEDAAPDAPHKSNEPTDEPDEEEPDTVVPGIHDRRASLR